MNEDECIQLFKDLIKFPHACKQKEQIKGIDFEMNGPLYDKIEQTQFIVRCLDCGYCHSLFITTKEAIIIRKFCIEKGIHTSDRFQKLDCHLCRRGEMQWQCRYFTRGMLKACKGFLKEEEDFSKYVANKVFP